MSVQTVSIKTIASKIARDYKGIDFDINDIGEWCFEVVKEVGSYNSFREVLGEILESKNRKWKLPCDVYRLLEIIPMQNVSVYNSSGDRYDAKYDSDGTYLRFQNEMSNMVGKNYPMDGTKLKIDYLAYNMDDDGMPMIEDTAQDACFWYCVMKIKLEDFLNGKFPNYPYLEQKYNGALAQARSSMRGVTRNQMNRVMRAKYNIIPKLRIPRA